MAGTGSKGQGEAALPGGYMDSQGAPGGSAAGGKPPPFSPSWRAACRAGKPQLRGHFGAPLQLVVLGGSVLTLP